MTSPSMEIAAAAPGPVRPCVVVPTFDNAATLAGILDGLRPLALPVIVVDDDSTDDTTAVLDRWRRDHPDATLHVERHPRNRGKADALRTGFDAGARLGATHAVSIDADGQHDPRDVPALLDLANRRPDALILGTRRAHIPGCPPRCLLGRRVANALVLSETLERLADTQCGLRVYPLGLVRAVRCRAPRFGFETEIIVRAAWAGCPILESPVTCVYEVPGGRVSHWRPVVDTLRDARLHARLMARSLVPLPHARWPADADELGAARRHARRAAAWISPRALWREIRNATSGDATVPAALALGAFVACSPFYGLHAWLSLYGAWRLRLHPLPAVLGSMLSTPPIGIAIIAASIQVGHFLLTGRPLGVGEFESGDATWWGLSGHLLGAWLLGSVVVGAGVAIAVYLLAARAARLVARPMAASKPDHEPA